MRRLCYRIVSATDWVGNDGTGVAGCGEMGTRFYAARAEEVVMRAVQMMCVSVVAGLAWGWSSGCSEHDHEHHRPVVVERTAPAVVSVEPGYYYDPEFYDERGAFHPRTYYHY